MRRTPNAVLTAPEADFESHRDADEEIMTGSADEAHYAALSVAVDATVAEVVRSAERLVVDLTHDLRQPLTSMSMNLQCAIRYLQSTEPRLSSALEALTECLEARSELLALISAVRDYLADEVQESRWYSLNDILPTRYRSRGRVSLVGSPTASIVIAVPARTTRRRPTFARRNDGT